MFCDRIILVHSVFFLPAQLKLHDNTAHRKHVDEGDATHLKLKREGKKTTVLSNIKIFFSKINYMPTFFNQFVFTVKLGLP